MEAERTADRHVRGVSSTRDQDPARFAACCCADRTCTIGSPGRLRTRRRNRRAPRVGESPCHQDIWCSSFPASSGPKTNRWLISSSTRPFRHQRHRGRWNIERTNDGKGTRNLSTSRETAEPARPGCKMPPFTSAEEDHRHREGAHESEQVCEQGAREHVAGLLQADGSRVKRDDVKRRIGAALEEARKASGE